jgi:hypothetical protein
MNRELAAIIRANLPKVTAALLRILDDPSATAGQVLQAASELRATADTLDPPVLAENQDRLTAMRQRLAELLDRAAAELPRCEHCGRGVEQPEQQEDRVDCSP